MKKAIFLGILLMCSALIYGQNEYNEEHENKMYQLEEYEEMKNEIDEKISYVKKLIETGSDIHSDVLIEYEELKKELNRDIEILKLEVKGWNLIKWNF